MNLNLKTETATSIVPEGVVQESQTTDKSVLLQIQDILGVIGEQSPCRSENFVRRKSVGGKSAKNIKVTENGERKLRKTSHSNELRFNSMLKLR